MRVTLILSILLFLVTEIFSTETPVLKNSVTTREELEELYAVPDMVFRCLLHEEKELQSWSEELEKKTPQTPKDVWTTFVVCTHAGKNEIVCQMLVLMHDMPLEKIERPDQYADHVYKNIRFTKQTPIKCNPLKVFYESFGAVYFPYYPSDIDPLINEMRNEKWSQEQINQWLKERFEQALSRQYENLKSIIWVGNYIHFLYPISPAAQQWQSHYFTQLRQSNRAEQIVTQFANEAYEKPDDFAKLAVFLLSLGFCNKTNLDVNWLGDHIDQYTAVQTWIIGRSIVNVKDSMKLCETFLKHALDKELDNEDCKRFQAILQWRTNMGLPKRENELVQAIFRVEVMDDLNRMYLDQKRNDEAPKIMIAARDIRKKYHLPEGSLLAGVTQMSSGQRIVEAEIKAREEINNTKPRLFVRMGRPRSKPQKSKQQNDDAGNIHSQIDTKSLNSYNNFL
jgi:hypothetical protein